MKIKRTYLILSIPLLLCGLLWLKNYLQPFHVELVERHVSATNDMYQPLDDTKYRPLEDAQVQVIKPNKWPAYLSFSHFEPDYLVKGLQYQAAIGHTSYRGYPKDRHPDTIIWIFDKQGHRLGRVQGLPPPPTNGNVIPTILARWNGDGSKLALLCCHDNLPPAQIEVGVVEPRSLTFHSLLTTGKRGSDTFAHLMWANQQIVAIFELQSNKGAWLTTIYAISVDTHQVRQVYVEDQAGRETSEGIARTQLSPDGNLLAFDRLRYFGLEAPSSVWLLNLQTGNCQKVASWAQLGRWEGPKSLLFLASEDYSSWDAYHLRIR